MGTDSATSLDRVSPVRTLPSLVTAAMSPVATWSVLSWSAPVNDIRLWSRSLSLVRLLTSVSLARMVPESTLMNEICPRKSSMRVLNTSATGEPAESMSSSTDSPPRTAATGPVAPPAGPTRPMKSSRWSTPIGLVAEPHSTGNTVRSRTASPISRSSCS